MSSTREAEIWERERRERRTCARRSDAGMSLRPPLPPLVKGVRRALVITMSSGDLRRRDSVPREVSILEAERWD